MVVAVCVVLSALWGMEASMPSTEGSDWRAGELDFNNSRSQPAEDGMG